MSKPSFFSYEHRAYPVHITANVILATFLTIISAVATMISSVTIQGDLALSDTDTVWLTTLYMLGANTMVPAANWFGDQFGRDRMYTLGILLFTIASLLAGLSIDFPMFALSRFFQGVGAGFIFPLGLGLIVQSMPKERVGIAINLYVGIAFGGGLGLGVPLSGYLSQFADWRDIFFFIVPFGLLATLSSWLSRKKMPEFNKSSFDFFGFFFFALFIASLLIALTMGPIKSTAEGWRSPYIIFLFISAAFSLIACLIIENKHSNPIIPLELFKNPIFTLSVAAMFLLGMATFASVTMSVDYMLYGLGYERFVIGKIAAVYGITLGVVSMIANALSHKIPIPILTFSGLALLVFSYFNNNELSWLTGYSQVIAILLIRGVGIGLALGPTTILALADIPQKTKTSASALLTFFRQVGGTYGSTLLSVFSIQQTIFHTARFGEQANTQLPAYKKTFQNLYDKMPDPSLAKAAIVKNILTQAYIQGLNDALIVFGYVTGVVALVLMICIAIRSWKNRRTLTL